jgi:hypothetical protein
VQEPSQYGLPEASSLMHRIGHASAQRPQELHLPSAWSLLVPLFVLTSSIFM